MIDIGEMTDVKVMAKPKIINGKMSWNGEVIFFSVKQKPPINLAKTKIFYEGYPNEGMDGDIIFIINWWEETTNIEKGLCKRKKLNE